VKCIRCDVAYALSRQPWCVTCYAALPPPYGELAITLHAELRHAELRRLIATRPETIEERRAELVECGILDEDGNLAAKYRGGGES
jgi:hypothetical protein